MSETTLHLWVNNMPTDFDATRDYIRATGFVPAAGVAYDADETTLSGADPEAVFAEFVRLRGLVAAAGHGDTADGGPIDGTPDLTACPADLIDPQYTCAAESLARLESHTAGTFAEWSAAVPSMAAGR